MKDLILKYALANAVKFNGKANPGAVIGAVFGLDPELKKKAKEIGQEVAKVVKEVNAMSLDDQKAKLDSLGGVEEKKNVLREGLKELKNAVKGKVVMRFAPSPSGPMHIGHAMTGGLTSLYCKKYDGKFILRIEDTNPGNIYPDAYKMIPDEADWVFGNVSEVWIQSDRMKIYYKYLEKLIKLNSCYVCTCSQEQFKEKSKNKEDCPCRKLDVKENQERWKKMLDKKGYKEGEVVVRFKSGMQDKNPAMRDFPLARINENEHPRQGDKFRVWPLMNLSVTVDDIEAGMTHIIRAKEHADNSKRQEKMFKVLGKKFPETYFLGRYNFTGLQISCSKTKEKIEKGEFSGWDDIRLPFIAALRKRGLRPEAFMKFTEEVGISNVDKSMSGEEYFKKIYSFNKEILDPISKRFFFVEGSSKVKIKHCLKEVSVPNHPEKDLGNRKLGLTEEFYVKDKIGKGVYRFMHLFNFSDLKFVSAEYDAELKAKIIHAVPVEGAVDVEVLMDDGKVLKGKGEKALTTLSEGSVVQFERFAFVRLDKKGKTLRFVYTHG